MSSANRSRHAAALRWLGSVALLAGAYAFFGRAGLQFAHYFDAATLIWPPTGIALASLVLFGRRLWPGVFVGALLLNVGEAGAPIIHSAFFATGNTLEAVVGTTLLRRAGFRPTLARIQDVAAFLSFGVVGCTLISATIGVGTLVVLGGLEAANPLRVWLIWWFGDMGGAIIMAPLIFMLVRGQPPWRELARRAESWVVLALLFVTSAIPFGGYIPGLASFAAGVAPFPVMVWAGARFGPRGATMASFLVLTVATWGTVRGLGPFAMGSPTDAMVILFAFGMFMGITAFTLAAVIGQRDAAEARYRAGEADRLQSQREKLLLLERERMMREMHDGLGGQLVSTIAMVERGRSTQREVTEALRRALDDMRIVVDSLDPSTTDLTTSLGKLRARLEPLLRRNGVTLCWQVEEVAGMDGFSPEQSLHLLRIVQEAVTNALRHAKAGEVTVRIGAAGGGARSLAIEIRDDGCGLPPEGATPGRGIQHMNARAGALGAELRIDRDEPGTRVELRVAIPR